LLEGRLADTTWLTQSRIATSGAIKILPPDLKFLALHIAR